MERRILALHLEKCVSVVNKKGYFQSFHDACILTTLLYLGINAIDGNVHQILDIPATMEQPAIHQVVDKAKRNEDAVVIQAHRELISPRTRSAMVIHNDVVETMRERAGILSKDWNEKDNLAPTLARRLRDFEFAQKKRRRLFGETKKWGILGLYDFLSAVRQDVEWAEDAAFRRANYLP